MKRVEITLSDELYQFYQNVGEKAGGLQIEQVIADALFKLAGELSLTAICKKRTEND